MEEEEGGRNSGSTSNKALMKGSIGRMVEGMLGDLGIPNGIPNGIHGDMGGVLRGDRMDGGGKSDRRDGRDGRGGRDGRERRGEGANGSTNDDPRN